MEDVGRVRVQLLAPEGLCLVLWCVARVVEWVVGVFVFARSAWLVHAVGDCDPGEVGAGPSGCCGEQPLGLLRLVPCYGRVGVVAEEPGGHPRVGSQWQVCCGVNWVACEGLQYGPRCFLVPWGHIASSEGHLLAVLGDRR